MGDASPPPSLLPLPPSTGTFTPGTPSGLTPNTRSEAEAALTLNSIAQTDSAAPTTPLPIHSKEMGGAEGEEKKLGAGSEMGDLSMTEAQHAYHRPMGPIRTSSTNYQQALLQARERSSVSSNMSDTIGSPTSTTLATSPTTSTPSLSVTFPQPGQGVVPLNPGISAGQAEVVRKAKPSGLSLGELGRQQSWKEQDRRHVYSQGLMAEVRGDAGYSSGNEGRAVES